MPSQYAVLAPGRKGLIICFLQLLIFHQNRVQLVQPLCGNGSFCRLERPLVRELEPAKSCADKKPIGAEMRASIFLFFGDLSKSLPFVFLVLHCDLIPEFGDLISRVCGQMKTE